MASSSQSVTATITGVSQGTDWIPTRPGGYFDISVGTTGSGTITLQRRLLDGDGTAYDVATYAPLDAPEVGHSVNWWEWRLYCKTGDYTSGSIEVGIWAP